MNEALRTAMRQRNVKQWEVAEALGISEYTLCKKLRHQLPEDLQAKLLEVIETIADKKGAKSCRNV